MIKKSSKKKIALITGALGQDGTLLSQLLLKKNYDIIRLDKRKTLYNETEIDHCNILVEKDIQQLLKSYNISEIYHLAAKVLSTEKRTFDENKGKSFIENFEVNVKSLHNILINVSKDTKIFYPTSSYIFEPSDSKLNEKSKISPSNLYAINKASSFWLAKYYRENFNLFISTGIMFNHESSLRSDYYITTKIIIQAKEILSKNRKFFEVNNLNQLVDWGHAEDYVDAMYKILQLSYPDDFVISSGSLHSIKDFIKIVCKKLNINYSDDIVKSNTNKKTTYFYGDNSKIIESTKWRPSKSLEKIVEDMI